MSLVTRCPACATAFRVHPAQLSTHGGSVRCGKCHTVFNGVSALVTEGPEPLALEPSPQLGLFDPRQRHPEALEGEELPAFMAEPPERRGALWWALAAFLAASALIVQAGYRYRTEIALFAPELRSALDTACRSTIGCEVPLPRRADLMSIDSSDLQADPRREGVIVLNALLRNRARFTQEFPALELTLTDEADRPVLRRVLRPADYMDQARGAQGIAAGAEAPLRIYLDPSRARATGYRLYLFYPT